MGISMCILDIKVYPFIICHELSCYVSQIKLKIEEGNSAM